MKKYILLLISFLTGVVIMIIITHVKMPKELLDLMCWISAFLIAIPIIIFMKLWEHGML